MYGKILFSREFQIGSNLIKIFKKVKEYIPFQHYYKDKNKKYTVKNKALLILL